MPVGRSGCTRKAASSTPCPATTHWPTLLTYIDADGIAKDRKGFLFRTSPGHNGTVLTGQPMNQADAWRMIPCRAVAVGIFAQIGNHTFGRQGSQHIRPMAVRSHTRSRWPHTKARARRAL